MVRRRVTECKHLLMVIDTTAPGSVGSLMEWLNGLSLAVTLTSRSGSMGCLAGGSVIGLERWRIGTKRGKRARIALTRLWMAKKAPGQPFEVENSQKNQYQSARVKLTCIKLEVKDISTILSLIIRSVISFI